MAAVSTIPATPAGLHAQRRLHDNCTILSLAFIDRDIGIARHAAIFESWLVSLPTTSANPDFP
jgi:hypothetical protein